MWMRPANLVARGCIVCRAVLDLLAIDLEVHQVIRPIDFLDRPWGDQNLFARPPVRRVDDEIMDAPIGILQEEVLDVTDLAVAGVDMIPGDRFNAAEMRIVVALLRRGNILCAPHRSGGTVRARWRRRNSRA